MADTQVVESGGIDHLTIHQHFAGGGAIAHPEEDYQHHRQQVVEQQNAPVKLNRGEGPIGARGRAPPAEEVAQRSNQDDEEQGIDEGGREAAGQAGILYLVHHLRI